MNGKVLDIGGKAAQQPQQRTLMDVILDESLPRKVVLEAVNQFAEAFTKQANFEAQRVNAKFQLDVITSLDQSRRALERLADAVEKVAFPGKVK